MVKYRDGYHFNSTYWQSYRKNLPNLSQQSFDIALGMLLGDASIYRTSHEAHIKFEQGYQQEEFLRTQFQVFSAHCFSTEPSTRYIEKHGKMQVKSFYFKTLSHRSFTQLFVLFFPQDVCLPQDKQKQKKSISKNLIRDSLTA